MDRNAPPRWPLSTTLLLTLIFYAPWLGPELYTALAYYFPAPRAVSFSEHKLLGLLAQLAHLAAAYGLARLLQWLLERAEMRAWLRLEMLGYVLLLMGAEVLVLIGGSNWLVPNRLYSDSRFNTDSLWAWLCNFSNAALAPVLYFFALMLIALLIELKIIAWIKELFKTTPDKLELFDGRPHWKDGSTVLLALLLYAPFLGPDLCRVLGLNFTIFPNMPTFRFPFQFSLVYGLEFLAELFTAYGLAVLLQWFLGRNGMRAWLRLSLRGYFLLMLGAAFLVWWGGSNWLVPFFRLEMDFKSADPLWLMLVSFSNAALAPLIYLAVVLVAAMNREGASYGGYLSAKPIPRPLRYIPAPPPADDTFLLLPLSGRERLLGALPLFVVIVLMLSTTWLLGDVVKLFKTLGVDLPLPSRLMVHWWSCAPVLPSVISLLLLGFYFGWICRSRRRVFWFNLVLIIIAVLNLHVLWLAVFAPFYSHRNSCLMRGTLVDTPAGPHPIEDLKAGDEIISRTPGNEPAISRVVKVRRADVQQVLRIELEGGVWLCTTAEHPFALRERWARAGDLQVGDVVLCRENDRAIVSITPIAGPAQVYDLSVEPYHNLVANSVLVHNRKK